MKSQLIGKVSQLLQTRQAQLRDMAQEVRLKIESAILSGAEQGYTTYHVDVTDSDRAVVQFVTKQLRNEGFTVRQQFGGCHNCTQRMGLVIRFNEKAR